MLHIRFAYLKYIIWISFAASNFTIFYSPFFDVYSMNKIYVSINCDKWFDRSEGDEILISKYTVNFHDKFDLI